MSSGSRPTPQPTRPRKTVIVLSDPRAIPAPQNPPSQKLYGLDLPPDFAYWLCGGSPHLSPRRARTARAPSPRNITDRTAASPALARPQLQRFLYSPLTAKSPSDSTRTSLSNVPSTTMKHSAVSDRRRPLDRSFLDEDDDDLISEVRELNRQKRKNTARAPLDDADDGVVVVSGLTSEVRKASKENAIAQLTRKREKHKTPGEEPESSSMAAARSRRRQLGSQHGQETSAPTKRPAFVLSSPSGPAHEDASSVYDVDEDMDLAQEMFGDQSGSPQSKASVHAVAIDLTGDDDPIETGPTLDVASQRDFRDSVNLAREEESDEDYDEWPLTEADLMAEAASSSVDVAAGQPSSSPYHQGDPIIHPIVKLSDMRPDFQDFYTNHWRRSETNAQARDGREELGNGRAPSTRGGSRGGRGRSRSSGSGWRGGFSKPGARRGGGRARGRA